MESSEKFPFVVKPFAEMTKKEARSYFDWFVFHLETRIEELKSKYVADGHDPDVLDGTPESLIPLGSWYVNQVEARLTTAEEREQDAKNIPEKYRNIISPTQSVLTDDTITLAIETGVYFATVFQNQFDSLRWGIKEKPRGHLYYNQPVLIGFKYEDLNPAHVLKVVASKAAIDGERNERELYRLYESWSQDVVENSSDQI